MESKGFRNSASRPLRLKVTSIFPAFLAKVLVILFRSWLDDSIRANHCGQGGGMAWDPRDGVNTIQAYGPRVERRDSTKENKEHCHKGRTNGWLCRRTINIHLCS